MGFELDELEPASKPILPRQNVPELLPNQRFEFGLEEAEAIAEDLLTGKGKLANYFTRYEIVGSIRRKKDIIHDIDIVAIAKPDSEFGFGEPLLDNHIQNITDKDDPNRKLLQGKKIKSLYYHGMRVDINLATPETYECLRLIKTGSEQHNIRLTTLAQGKGLRLFASGAGLCSFKMEKDKAVPVNVIESTEDGILKYLLGRVPKPEDRN